MDYKLDENYTVTEDNVLGTKIEHPAFGTIAFSRHHNGGSQSLFGSSVYHHDTIQLAIRHADMTRGLNNDWYYGHNEIVECEMSYAQFVEAITNMNNGTGIPCTLTYTEKDGHLPNCQFIDKYTEFTDEMSSFLEEQTADAEALYDEIKTLFETKKSIGKNDRETILKKLHAIVNGTKGNTQFIFKQFQKQMDKTVEQAKGEIEAFTQNKMLMIAQQSLVENKEQLQNAIQDNVPSVCITAQNQED